MTLFNGGASNGGAILNNGLLILNECVFYDNFANNGGAIYNGDGCHTVINGCAFIRNSCYEYGSAIYNCDNSELQINKSIFFENITPDSSQPIHQHKNGQIKLNACVAWDGENFYDITNPEKQIVPSEIVDLQLLNTTLYQESRYRRLRHEAPVKAEDLLSVYQHRWFAPHDWIERFLEVDNHTFLMDLATYANKEHWNLTTLQKPAKQLAKDIIRRLASAPGLQNLLTLLRISIESGIYYYHKDQDELAVLIASGQKPETILQIFESMLGEELVEILGFEPRFGQMTRLISILYRLQQELVMRGVDCVSLPYMRQFWEKYKNEQRTHGVGLLPLKLHIIEREVHSVMSTYHLDPAKSISAVDHYFFPLAGGPRLEFLDADSPIIKLRKRTTPKFRLLVSQAVENWTFEVALYLADEPITIESITEDFLLSLNLQCLKGIRESLDIRLHSTDPIEVFTLLFAAASTHNTTSEGHGHIQGRLRAWRSLSGLVGGNAETSFEEVESLANQCSWRLFWAASGWYYESYYHLGIVCLRPDGMSLSVLAAAAWD